MLEIALNKNSVSYKRGIETEKIEKIEIEKPAHGK
jgi:hypothetical protein